MINAYVLGKIGTQSENEILEDMAKIQGVQGAYLTFGRFDFVLKVKADDKEQLQKLLIDSIRKVGGVRSTTTLLVTSGKTNR